MDFGAGTNVVIGIVRMVVVDLEPVIVPVDVRNIAVVVARTRLLAGSVKITGNLLQNRLSYPVARAWYKVG